MKIPVIKKMVEAYSIEELKKAEAAILEGEAPEIEIAGEDDGEQLTHAIAALEILTSMAEQGLSQKDALRQYSQRVRNSIS